MLGTYIEQFPRHTGVDVALEMAGAFNTACLRVVHATSQTFSQQHETHLFVRGLMGGSTRLLTVTPLSFGEFRHSASCYKPLEIFITSNQTKAEFAWVNILIYLYYSIGCSSTASVGT